MPFFTRRHRTTHVIILMFICIMIMISFYIIHTQHDVLFTNQSPGHLSWIINKPEHTHLSSHQTNNMHPPKLSPCKKYVIKQNNDINKAFHETFWANLKPLTPIPSLSNDNKMYIMNIIYNNKAQEINIFLLNKIYFDSKRGLHSWPRKRMPNFPSQYKNIANTLIDNYKNISPSFACVFVIKTNNILTYYVSKVYYVPNNTTRDRYVNDATEILRCKTPQNMDFNTFLLTQKHKQIEDIILGIYNNTQIETHNLIHIQLTFDSITRMAVQLLTKNSHKNERYISLCMPPISEPLPFIIENIVHHLLLGIQHIYIGTHFKFDKKDQYLLLLLERIKPWYDKGVVSIWSHEQIYLSFTDKAKHHWLNQCLYYAKSIDKYVLSLDVDEFLLLHALETEINVFDRKNILKTMLNKVTKNGEREWCWLTFASYQMWQLTNPNGTYMIERYNGKEDNYQYTWSKIIWNTKYLWYTGYHAGGSCCARNHSWYDTVDDWRDEIDEKHVYRWNPINEGRIWHFYNSRYIRIEPKDKNKRNPWFNTVYDNSMIEYYLPGIKEMIRMENHVKPSYPDDEFDVMNDPYYIKHYGIGKSQLNFVN
eukprot:64351_1